VRSFFSRLFAVFVLPACAIGLLAAPSRGADVPPEPAGSPETVVNVSFRGEDEHDQQVRGRLLVEDQQGGILLEDPAGVLWTITADQITNRETVEEPFEWLGPEELGASLREVVGPGCEIIETKHYVIATQAGRAYSQWCGTLFERLRSGFLDYWKRAKLPLEPREGPLPIIILGSREQFADYARRDGAAAVIGAAGYYSARTNRVVLYDLTAEAGNGRPLGAAASRQEITARLQGAQGSIATVVHEAVHQLAFNSGLQVRYADNPMWISEGLAMYFETPDLRSSSGWRGIGRVNPARLLPFRESLPTRPADSLLKLVRDDERFRNLEQAPAAYAESWALVHYLATNRREELAAYLKQLGARRRLDFDEPAERVSHFEDAFGDLTDVDRQMLKHVARLRSP
jgi:hypothetical protein